MKLTELLQVLIRVHRRSRSGGGGRRLGCRCRCRSRSRGRCRGRGRLRCCGCGHHVVAPVHTAARAPGGASRSTAHRSSGWGHGLVLLVGVGSVEDR
jgi:hypothetical protein